MEILLGDKIILIDDSDYHLIESHSWSVNKFGGGIEYVVAWFNGKQISLHRLIMQPPSDFQVDHCNGNGLDNRRENLRIANRSQNMANRRATGVSVFLGVCPKRNKWRAQIKKDGKVKYLGTFNKQEEAARAYNIAATSLHGEFARLNQIY
jgi:hypothetical protein